MNYHHKNTFLRKYYTYNSTFFCLLEVVLLDFYSWQRAGNLMYSGVYWKRLCTFTALEMYSWLGGRGQDLHFLLLSAQHILTHKSTALPHNSRRFFTPANSSHALCSGKIYTTRKTYFSMRFFRGFRAYKRKLRERNTDIVFSRAFYILFQWLHETVFYKVSALRCSICV